MFALLLLGLVASPCTAWWHSSRYDPYKYNNGYHLRMDRFWDNFEREMDDLKYNMENIMQNNNNQEWSTIEGNEYKLNIIMNGFNKEDIVVKAKKGNIVIQANHNVPGEPTNNSLFVKDLPDFVNENGSWSYNKGVLTVFFPIIQRGTDNTRESNLPNKVDRVNEKSNGNYNRALINGGV